ncbi:outer membrane protein [Piscirickettsia litoralis]|uniref:Meta-pathway of phenol degradation family protein n=1 Tax=Piscirickettsia litoralis TaxID=1891921 RepID=A0ABX3A0C6_9GAMM|nr:outer membrane beta-barrel protein [Piscirickettsia litoralis]ODN42316.1 meta-pathway of phenol degradation family protein [Piscirickettsia litoralis]
MIKKTLIAAAVIGSMGVTAAAFAQTGVYVEGQAGYTLQRKMNVPTATNKDRKKIGGRVAIGYNYDINDMFGLGAELGYGYYGKTSYTVPGVTGDATAKSTGFDLVVVPTWHINPQFDLFAKAGLMREKLSGEDAAHGDNTATKVVAGLGAGYNITPALQINMTYQHVFGNNMDNGATSDSDVPSIDSVFAGVKYTF